MKKTSNGMKKYELRPQLTQMLTLNISFAALLAIFYTGSLIRELK
jgi:hypothetical protein